MGALADMSRGSRQMTLAAFDPRAVIELPARDDPKRRRAGVHRRSLSAITWRWSTTASSFPRPRKTTEELVAAAKANTVDEDGDGNADRYGIVWNYTEPYFVIPFLTGYGAWVFEEPPGDDGRRIPTLDTPEMVRGLEFVASLRHKEQGVAALRRLRNRLRAVPRRQGGNAHRRRLELAAVPVDAKDLDAAVAVLPEVAETGLPMAPMASPKGYSLSVVRQGTRPRKMRSTSFAF